MEAHSCRGNDERRVRMAVLLDDWMDGHMSGDGMNEHFPFLIAHEKSLIRV